VCGIIGYVGQRACKDLLLQGLERLEYRGYDSAGLALLEDGALDYDRAVGNLQVLKKQAGSNGSQATTGLGHTRWATHGAVNMQNAHPLTGCDEGKLAIVLNGIVENYRELKGSLESEGHSFHTETDAEVVVHLIERHYKGDLLEATREAYRELEGHFAFVVVHHDHPDELVGARLQCPLLVGVGNGEMFFASMAAAFISETRSIQLIEDGEVVSITPDGARFVCVEDGELEREVIEVDWDMEAAEKSGYETFMLKEIYEQPEAVAETLGDRIRHGELVLESLGMTEEQLRNLRRIVIVAAGTSYHAGVVGRYMIEEWARLPVEPDIASEWI
jgi:glutamine---fructose-6-phosphate transaminase (isomerizing)